MVRLVADEAIELPQAHSTNSPLSTMPQECGRCLLSGWQLLPVVSEVCFFVSKYLELIDGRGGIEGIE